MTLHGPKHYRLALTAGLLFILGIVSAGDLVAQTYSNVARRHPLALVQEEDPAPTSTTRAQAQSQPRTTTRPPSTAQSRANNSNRPTAATSATTQASQKNSSARRRRRRKSHGHFFTTNRFDFVNLCCPLNGNAEFMAPGRFAVADNNSPYVDDRLIFDYQFFRNGLDAGITSGGTSSARRFDVNQVTLGFEKVFGHCDNWSLEMRLPLYSVNDTLFTEGFSTGNPGTGNLIAIAKRQICEDDCRTISAGLGMSLPTGDDSSFFAVDELFTVNNDAVHLQPFVASVWRPNECWFLNSFLAVDFATTGNRIDYRQLFAGGAATTLGELSDQSLLHVDLSAGYWWYQCSAERGLTAVVSAFELHYVSTLNMGDVVTGNTPGNYYHFAPGSRNFDILDATLGLDIEFSQTTILRTALVVPLRNDDDRFFDNEVQASINRRF